MFQFKIHLLFLDVDVLTDDGGSDGGRNCGRDCGSSGFDSSGDRRGGNTTKKNHPFISPITK